jgi:hypothetical protein
MSEFRTIAGLKAGKRKFKKKGPAFAASMLVRKGLVADVERPLPSSEAPKRKAKRIPTSLKAKVGGKWRRVSGDVSGGGALLLLAEQLQESQVEISIALQGEERKWDALAEIVRCEYRGERIAYHLRFVDAAQVEGLDEAIERCIAEGAKRLRTT